MKTNTLDSFTRAYLAAALFSSLDGSRPDGGDPLDQNYGITDFAPAALEMAIRDCARFQRDNAEDIAAGCTRGSGEYSPWEQAGHDFWLTRNGHGAGFWDGDWQDGNGDKSRANRLTASAKGFGEVDPYVGDDGAIHFDREDENTLKSAGLHYTQTGTRHSIAEMILMRGGAKY